MGPASPTPSAPVAAREPVPPAARLRGGPALLLWLALAAGAVATGHAWPAAALAGGLSIGLLGPGLALRSRGALAVLVLSFTLMAVAAWRGGAPLVLALLPAQASAQVAWLFARTLRRGRTPLVALAVAAIEGPARLEVPGLRAHARRLSLGWALACSGLAALGLAAAWAEGRTGQGLRLAMPLATGLLFAAEYRWRRHRFADVAHSSFGRFLLQLARGWNGIVRESFREAA